jgi:hypothetical protein
MGKLPCDQSLERARERARLLGCEIQTKYFDGHEPIAIGIVRPKDRTENARADLMKNPKRPECLWWKVQEGVFVGQ